LDRRGQFGCLDEILSILAGRPDIVALNADIGRNEGLQKSLKEWRQTNRKDPFMGKGQDLYRKARQLIPGGTQLLSKRPEMFLPEQWPSYFSKAKGAEVWDLDGRQYLDMTHCSVGACVLGYADPEVDGAVKAAIDAGNMATLNCPEEVELAEVLLQLHPWAEKVRFARGGGDAMAVAVRIARAAAGRDKIAFCGYHGWHDWYLGANLGDDTALDGHLLPGLAPAGVPRGLRGTVLPFEYDRIEQLNAVIAAAGPDLGAIVMEPVRNEPAVGFLQAVREIATRTGAVLVFDEVSAGFRITAGGSHLKYGVNPDIAVVAKAMSNGYPMGAIIGRAAVMEAAQKSFISSTYWTDRIGPAASLATIRKFRDRHVADHLISLGTRVQEGWQAAAEQHGLSVHVGGIPPLSHFSFDYPNGQAVRTLFTQLMLDRAFLAGTSFYPMLAHTSANAQSYLSAVDEVFGLLAGAIAEESVERRLKGPVAHSGFARLTG